MEFLAYFSVDWNEGEGIRKAMWISSDPPGRPLDLQKLVFVCPTFSTLNLFCLFLLNLILINYSYCTLNLQPHFKTRQHVNYWYSFVYSFFIPLTHFFSLLFLICYYYSTPYQVIPTQQ